LAPGPTHPGPAPVKLWFGAGYKAFVSKAQPFRGFLKPIEEISGEVMSPQANHPGLAGAEAWG